MLLAGCAQGPTVPIGFFAPDGRCLHPGGSLGGVPRACDLEDGVVLLGAEPWMVAGAPDLEIELDGPGQLIDPLALRCCGVGGCATSTTACPLDQTQQSSFRWRASGEGEVEVVARQQGDVVFEGLATVDQAADYRLEFFEGDLIFGERADANQFQAGRLYKVQVRTVGAQGGLIRDDRSPHRLTLRDPAVAGFCFWLFPYFFLNAIDERASELSLCGRQAGLTTVGLEKAGQVRSLPIKFVGTQAP